MLDIPFPQAYCNLTFHIQLLPSCVSFLEQKEDRIYLTKRIKEPGAVSGQGCTT